MGFRVRISSWIFELDFRVRISSWIFELDFPVSIFFGGNFLAVFFFGGVSNKFSVVLHNLLCHWCCTSRSFQNGGERGLPIGKGNLV